MKEFKGTKGPWTAAYNGNFCDISPKGSRQSLAMVHVNHHLDIDHDVEMANANLISAAPELLEACLRMRNQLYAAGYEAEKGSLNPTKCLLAQVEEAVAKAMGENK